MYFHYIYTSLHVLNRNRMWEYCWSLQKYYILNIFHSLIRNFCISPFADNFDLDYGQENSAETLFEIGAPTHFAAKMSPPTGVNGTGEPTVNQEVGAKRRKPQKTSKVAQHQPQVCFSLINSINYLNKKWSNVFASLKLTYELSLNLFCDFSERRWLLANGTNFSSISWPRTA